jgi:lysyl-tRNA synthetase class 2
LLAAAGLVYERPSRPQFGRAGKSLAGAQIRDGRRMTRASPWWARDVYADRKPFLKARGKIAAAVRNFFASEGFGEVETAALQVSGGNEAHISAFGVDLVGPSGEESRLYLHTSPEFSCKKLLAAGEERIFTFARVFRNRERGPLHHPEFTMLEWYRAGEPTLRLMEDCAGLLAVAARAVGASDFAWRDRTVDPFAEPELLSVSEAFAAHANIDLAALLDDREGLAHAAARDGIRVAPDDTWSDLFSKIMTEKVEHRLGCERPTILYDYPLSEAALARASADDPRFADRFELYLCGVEIANGFGELTDAAEQRRRLEAQMATRQRIYGESYPIDEDFLEALAVMPQASGIALGFDRLVMLASGAERIEQVLWTPVTVRGTAL